MIPTLTVGSICGIVDVVNGGSIVKGEASGTPAKCYDSLCESLRLSYTLIGHRNAPGTIRLRDIEICTLPARGRGSNPEAARPTRIDSLSVSEIASVLLALLIGSGRSQRTLYIGATPNTQGECNRARENPERAQSYSPTYSICVTSDVRSVPRQMSQTDRLDSEVMSRNMKIVLCESCTDFFRDETGEDDMHTLIDLAITLGVEFGDHLCDRIEVGEDVECVCAGHNVSRDLANEFAEILRPPVTETVSATVPAITGSVVSRPIKCAYCGQSGRCECFIEVLQRILSVQTGRIACVFGYTMGKVRDAQVSAMMDRLFDLYLDEKYQRVGETL